MSRVHKIAKHFRSISTYTISGRTTAIIFPFKRQVRFVNKSGRAVDSLMLYFGPTPESLELSPDLLTFPRANLVRIHAEFAYKTNY